MNAILLDFVRTCHENGIRPVVLFLPISDPAPYASFVRTLREDVLTTSAVVMDFGEAPAFDPGRIRLRADGGHLSPYGNRLLARYVAQQLGLDPASQD